MVTEAKTKLGSVTLQEIYDDLGAIAHAAARPVRRSGACMPARLELHVLFRGDAAAIERLATGLFIAHDPLPETGMRDGVGEFSTPNLRALVALPGVINVIEQTETIRPALNYSVPETRTTDLRAQFPWITGVGVTIVTIDIGIEWRHGAFMDANHKTRIKKLWDLTLTAGPGETVGPGNRGVVYTNDDIDQHRPMASKDEGGGGRGHGTFVAGIAAGNGAPPTCTCFGCCTRGGTYVGIAPEATLIAVRVDTPVHINVALALLARDPDLAGQPVVVNISMGMNDGPHDGTHFLEQSIDRFTASGPSRFVVVAAGNSAGLRQHATGTVPALAAAVPGTIDLPIRTRKGDTAASRVVLYHRAATPLAVQLVSPGGEASASLPTSAAAAFVVDGVQLSLAAHPLANGDLEVQLDATAPGRDLNRDGDWIVRFSNAGAQAVPIDAWVSTARAAMNWRFLDADETGAPGLRATDAGTITTPATARTAIAVANYQNRKNWCDIGWSGEIAEDSGRGPARNTAANPNPRPTIAAPGEGVTAPKYDAANLRGNLCSCCPDWVTALYDDDSGTSIAAPHVTGAIALMLQVNPTMTRDKLINFLTASARPAPAPADPNTWGVGKLDVNSAVARALEDSLPPPSVAARARAAARRSPASRAAPPLATVLRNLRAVPDGELVAALVSQHFSEARRLINAHRKVAAMWHRAGGPAMLRRLAMRAATHDAVPRDPRQADYVRRFLDQLQRVGSARLGASITRHAALIAGSLDVAVMQR